jgi:uncharacterized protein
MSLTLYEISIPVMLRKLQQLSAILDKAVAHAEANGIDLADLIGARLAPDMFTLAGQIQGASDAAKACAARLAGLTPPSFPDTEKTFAELHERIAKTISFLESVPADQIDHNEDRTINLVIRGETKSLVARTYALQFALPNFFFHVVTAYGVLRHKGVPIGKTDYLGTM